MSILGLPGAETHTLTHRGRSRVGMGRKQEPLICIKPHFSPLRANTTPPPLPADSSLCFNVCTHTHTLQSANHLYNLHYHHTHTHFCSSSSPLYPICSHRRRRCTYGEPQQQRPAAGTRSRDHRARLLEDRSRCNPVLHCNTGQVLFR